jgi:hypothetical protein
MIKSSYLTFVDLAGEIILYSLSCSSDQTMVDPMVVSAVDEDNVAHKSFTALATVVNLLSENTKHPVERDLPFTDQISCF